MAPQKDGETMAHAMEHSSEYYQQMKDDLNVLEITQRVYRRGNENILDLVKKFW